MSYLYVYTVNKDVFKDAFKVYNTLFVFAAHSLKNDTVVTYKNRCSARIHNIVLFT